MGSVFALNLKKKRRKIIFIYSQLEILRIVLSNDSNAAE